MAENYIKKVIVQFEPLRLSEEYHADNFVFCSTHNVIQG